MAGTKDPGKELVFSDINHSLSAAIAGQGLAMGDGILTRDSLRDGALIRLFRHAIPSTKSYYLVVSEEKLKKRTCAACVDWIQSEFRAPPSGETESYVSGHVNISHSNR